MSININVGNMNYKELSCAERAEIERRRKERIVQVREQSKEIAQQVRERVQCERKNQLKKFQEIKRKELENLRRRQRELMEAEYAQCLANFGAAHIAACEASCEEDEAIQQRREEYDLLAAERGRAAMLQEQRKRDREAEERLAKRKRKNLRSVSVQADLVTRRQVVDLRNTQHGSEDEVGESEDENPRTRVETFKNKPNLHKSHSTAYNPKDFTSHSVDSSNNLDSDEEQSSIEIDSEVEFNQITNLLKQKTFNFYQDPPKEDVEEVVDITSSSESEVAPRVPVQRPKQVKLPVEQPKKKGILKKNQPTKPVKPPQKQPEEDPRVSYVDFGNKYVSSYIPDNNLVTQNTQKTGKNAKIAAERHEQRSGKKVVSDDVLRQLAEIRSQKALEKEKTRRDYEKLRLQLDELAKEEQETRAANAKTAKPITPHQIQTQEQIRKARMNQAVENIMQRNIITCPPVDIVRGKKKTCEVNVAAPEDSEEIEEPVKRTSEEINSLVKVERLKDLLERINHQKKLLLREIEKSEDIPGPDLEQVMKCLQKLEKEKAEIVQKSEKTTKEVEEITAREKKVEEREKRLEDKIRELYKSHKEKQVPESITSSEETVSIPPVEIIIKVKSPRSKKQRKSTHVIDTLCREPKKVYPKTPKKKSKETREEPPDKIQQETQTTPPISEAPPKPILKKTSPVPSVNVAGKSDDSSQSISTSYHSLPDKLSPVVVETPSKQHHKLNPVLMHYIQRLLGMGKNFGNQLSVAVSPVHTPGSSTINTSGNNESGSDGQPPAFDQKRLDKLQEFINDNYSFLSEINETLERSQLQEENEENINKVDGIWREVLNKKKPSRSSGVSKRPSVVSQQQEKTREVQEPVKQVPSVSQPPRGRPQTAASSNQLQIPQTRLNIPPMRPQTARGSRTQTQAQEQEKQPQRGQSSSRQSSASSKPSQASLKPPQVTNQRPGSAQVRQQQVQSSQEQPKGSQVSRDSQQQPRGSQQSRGLQEQGRGFQQQSKGSQQQSRDIQQPRSSQHRLQVPHQQLQVPQNPQPPSQRPQQSSRPQISNSDMINVTKYLESHIMNNYAEYTANCQKRISDLATMMERVRQEKLKLIENSLSSGEFGQYTEYKEIVVPGKTQDQPTTSASDLKDSPSQREDPPSEEINNILQKQTRPFGVSKDSGISILSRPVTSSDFRDSPDVRVTSEERENTFQPILKDIPKPPRVKITPETPQPDAVINLSDATKEQEDKAKKNKPPPARIRVSPNPDPHELSTIAEVETPSASKVNLNVEDFIDPESFAKFDEYAKKFTSDQSEFFPNMMEVLEGEKIVSFLKPTDYGIQETSKANEQSLSRASSESSIVDVLQELRKRNLLPENGFKDTNDDDMHTTPTATHQVIQCPPSPVRNPPQSRIIIRTPEKIQIQIQAETPTKRKAAVKRVDEVAESPKSNDTLSGIQEIEKETRDDLQLDKMGLNWAASMLKRDGQSKNLVSSSSSSEKGTSIRIDIGANDSSTSSSSIVTGGPINLRQFLIRELNHRSLRDKSSSDESSLSSQFMRSLLNASSHAGSSSEQTSTNDRLRTSTPVATKGSSSHFATQKSGGTSLFPGESLSTLKGSDRGDSDKSNEKQS